MMVKAATQGSATETAKKMGDVGTTSEHSDESRKRKKPSSASTSSAPPPPSSSSPFRHMDDSEFMRSIAAEFKRRGYIVAIQLKVIPHPKSETGVNADTGTAENEAKATVNSPQKVGGVPETPMPLPSFPFHPSTVNISRKNSDSWNALFDQLRTFHDKNNGALPLHNADAEPDSDTAALCKWTKAQLTFWKRMKKDGRHNLSLDRIVKLHSLDFERFNKKKRSGGVVDEKEEDKDANPTPKVRKAYKKRVEFLHQDKLNILDEIDSKVTTEAVIREKYGISRCTIHNWKKSREKIRVEVEDKGRGEKMRIDRCDGLQRVKDGLYAFYELNNTLPETMKVQITCGVISRKAIDIKEKLELAHAVAPFLTEKEVEFFSNFKASLSWASKFAASARINVGC
mmetsp:Transcript_10728/g.26474  ORF Transcript_10728/g.26474 Transcript_10728/m.26474 type:complete len:399 (+) Transcript_10728:76-1272(+)